MTQPHPADADYTALNVPNEDALMAMADSALILHETLVRQGRRFSPSIRDDNATTIPDLTVVPAMVEFITSMETKPNYSSAIFEEAVAKAEAERGELSAVDSQMVRQFLAVMEEWMTRLRSLKAAESNAVMGHALNSLDLGRIGLAKVMGGSDAD